MTESECLRQRVRESERVTCGDADDLLDDGVLGLLVLTPAPGVLLVD